MAFRASNVIPQTAYQTVKGAAVQLRLNVQAMVAHLAVNDATYDYLRGVYQTLKRANDQFTTLRSTPGLADYAKAQEDDPTYDVAAEFVAMQNTIASTLTWMEANVPLSVTLRPMSEWNDSGSLVATSFTPAQTAQLRTYLNEVVASVA